MFSTRSPSLKGPATRAALLVSHGQPSDPQPAEDSLRRFAGRLQQLMPDWQIASATLAMPGRLEQALTDLPEGARIYPLFMSDGYFVRSALPKRLGNAPVHQLPPFGLDPALPGAVATYLTGVLVAKGWQAAQTDLLIASHGSARSAYSQEATEAFAAALRQQTGFARIHTGYVEQDPALTVAARNCARQSLCLPFFFAEGGHVRDDVDSALREIAFAGDRLDTIGNLPFTPGLIAKALAAAEMPAP